MPQQRTSESDVGCWHIGAIEEFKWHYTKETTDLKRTIHLELSC
ncbi:hypothetical protein [Vibrio europaeus]